MTKNEFKQLARKHGITDVRYSGNKKVMYIHGDFNKSEFMALTSTYSMEEIPWKLYFQ